MLLTKHSKIKLFPARERLVSDIPAGEGEIVNLFLQCRCSRPVIVDIDVMTVMLYCGTRTGKDDIAFLQSLVPLTANKYKTSTFNTRRDRGVVIMSMFIQTKMWSVSKLIRLHTVNLGLVSITYKSPFWTYTIVPRKWNISILSHNSVCKYVFLYADSRMAWAFAGYTTEKNLVSPRKQTTSGNISSEKGGSIKDDTLCLRNLYHI